MDAFRGFIAIAVLLLVAYIFSKNRRKINVRTVGSALLLQFVLGGLMLFIPAGRWCVEVAAKGITDLVSFANAGAAFVFGGLVGPKMGELFGDGAFVFALNVIPSIIFVTALISLLYYIGFMKWFIHILGTLFQKLLGVSKVEAFVAVTTMILGQNEIPAAVKPFINKMNTNELFTAMCSGMASIAGSMLIAYAGFGVPLEYLLAASLMAIPGGILFARILSPATEESRVEFKEMSFGDKKAASIIEAVSTGAMVGLKIGVGVATVVMTFVALIALINGLLGGIGNWFGWESLSLQGILGYVFSPLAYVMGIGWDDATLVGGLIGEKLAINEFVAYADLSHHMASLDTKSVAIISFALCGFANFGSIGVIVGAFGAICPERISEIAKLGVRALLAATLSNLMSATIAGIFIGFTL
ncbi:nucleoside permease [Gilliamella sp. wkB178]|uniref:NupC/NupG family nucleoside CNT transporter n=1 Tax=Gilliamella sp. wkB178 TaxID=3120259 RepID=UPI00080E4851|nr:NupC/NupG family nucleoside CNT transporter [Gilliamella apicola]OCG07001.1 nucleoside permease [Gilliamella apicola]